VRSEDYAEAIGKLWLDAQQTFLEIGRLLDEAQRQLHPAEFEAMLGYLPFGRSARVQLMQAYRLITSGTMPTGLEKAGYSVVYQITTLSDKERAQALAEGVINPGMRRQDVLGFKQRVRKLGQADRRTELLEEKRKLLQRLVAVRHALKQLY
jgi:hypothetical protein